MQLEASIQGTPCLIEVTHYQPALPMRITGSGFGDASPPEPEEIEYQVLTLDGTPAPELEEKITRDDDERICNLIRLYKNERPEP